MERFANEEARRDSPRFGEFQGGEAATAPTRRDGFEDCFFPPHPHVFTPSKSAIFPAAWPVLTF